VFDLTGYRLTVLRDGELRLSRGQAEDAEPILLVTPSEEHGYPEATKRLEHEYDPCWAAKPFAIIRNQVHLALLLKDPGGEPLDRLVGKPLSVDRFLHIAIALAVACHHMHERGLLHKDIKPANVLVDQAGAAWLMGFGVASRLLRERQSPAAPEMIAGTLAYMAPEQTGRMNRSIDSRSDLYALGITFYELLTGALPFGASDPMELVHCHIARRPLPPSQRSAAVPEVISSIVMKLIAKSMEDRYQTAGGAEFDLRRCLAAWEAEGRIDEFPLGEQDASDRLVIPEKLYGREREVDILLKAFDRVVTSATPELVILSGYSGVGKSSMANELHKAMVSSRGLFAAGKFDQYKRDIPYATLAQAFQGLIHTILSGRESELLRWREAISGALGTNGQLIANLVPELELVIGRQRSIQDLPAGDAKNRFQAVFRRFIGVFARPEHPLILFVDDLQWVDDATLDLILHLITHEEVRSLLLVGAYRDNEVDPSHPLTLALEAIRKAGRPLREIALMPLGLDDIGQLIGDAMRCDVERAWPLARLVHDKTGGNPFFTVQFVTELAEERLMTFDPAAAAWTWDLPRIRDKGYTGNVVDLMVGKLNRLSVSSLDALKLCACLGNLADIATLTAVYGTREADIRAALAEVVIAGILLRRDNVYAFVHDRLREAAYAIIQQDERTLTHLRIGRALALRRDAAEVEDGIFEIANQFNRGTALLDSPAERRQVSQLNLMAGRRAKNATAYASALNYLIAGYALLPTDSWQHQYRLTFDIEFAQAECEFLTGEFVAAEHRLTALAARAANILDRAAVTRLRVVLYASLNRPEAAIGVGLECVRHAGTEWSAHPTDDDVQQEYARMRKLLGRQPIHHLIDLPLLSDPDRLAMMDVLTNLMTPAQRTDRNLHHLIIFHMVSQSIEHGHCDGSCNAYAALDVILPLRSGVYPTDSQFIQLAYDLIERHGLDRYKARVYLAFGAHVLPWTKDLAAARTMIRRALDAANVVGDLSFAMYSCTLLVTNLLVSGEPLDEVQQEAEKCLAFAQKTQFAFVIDGFVAAITLIRALRGLTPGRDPIDAAGRGDGLFERRLEENPNLGITANAYWLHKQRARFFARNYGACIEATERLASLVPSMPPFIEVADYHFFGAMARAEACASVTEDLRRSYLDEIIAHQKQLAAWATNCPENFADRAALVAAEIARLDRRELDAEQLYEMTIRLARQNSFTHVEALANERAASFYAARDLDSISHLYLRAARDCYLRWGAVSKATQLEQSHPHLRQGMAQLPTSTTIDTSVEHLDIATVVKVSQAVSGEIDLGRLIDTLMATALRHAGGDRGLLLLPRGDIWQTEAEAVTVGDTVEVHLRHTEVRPIDLAESIVHYVMRTHDSVLLDDASEQNPFSGDDYIRRNVCRSLLCLPIAKQSRLVGILYIENSQTSHAFTPARMAVLKLLASQAAISLENARLYAELIAENKERQRVEDALRTSEASLSRGQSISRTGTWRWNIRTDEIEGSVEFDRIFCRERGADLSAAKLMERIHPEDRLALEKTTLQAAHGGGAFTCAFRVLLPDGAIRHLQSSGVPDNDSPGDFVFVGTAMDITERVRAQEMLQQTQANFAHAARIATLGELTASIAHEVNQPLGAIAASGEASLRWLSRDKPDLNEVQKLTSYVVADARRAAEIIARVRSMASHRVPDRQPLALDEVIEQAFLFLRHEIESHRVETVFELTPGLPALLADRVQLQQVIVNLAVNGIQAMSQSNVGQRKLTVRTGLIDSAALSVEIEDTGPGIAAPDADGLFKSFFTTKPDGMGMGLPVCRSIVEAHGGTIGLVNRAGGRGACFRFTLPTAIATS
jgi:predicted ATPase/signal transduction histidine kinase